MKWREVSGESVSVPIPDYKVPSDTIISSLLVSGWFCFSTARSSVSSYLCCCHRIWCAYPREQWCWSGEWDGWWLCWFGRKNWLLKRKNKKSIQISQSNFFFHRKEIWIPKQTGKNKQCNFSLAVVQLFSHEFPSLSVIKWELPRLNHTGTSTGE